MALGFQIPVGKHLFGGISALLLTKTQNSWWAKAHPAHPLTTLVICIIWNSKRNLLKNNIFIRRHKQNIQIGHQIFLDFV